MVSFVIIRARKITVGWEEWERLTANIEPAFAESCYGGQSKEYPPTRRGEVGRGNGNVDRDSYRGAEMERQELKELEV
jgi:hypothetical protein